MKCPLVGDSPPLCLLLTAPMQPSLCLHWGASIEVLFEDLQSFWQYISTLIGDKEWSAVKVRNGK